MSTTTDRFVHEGTGAIARWTGTNLIVETAAPVTARDLREVADWAEMVCHDRRRAATPVPNTPCPDWCTAASSIDPWIRTAHEWGFLFGSTSWNRTHHGPVGMRWREQFEMSAPDGTTNLRRVERGYPPKRRVLRDGGWYVVSEDGTETVR